MVRPGVACSTQAATHPVIAVATQVQRPPTETARFQTVQRFPGKIALLFAVGVCAAWPAAAPAQAQIAFAPCGDSNDFACGHLTVPVDPSGATPGAITLAIRRHRSPVGEAHSAVIALAGGPGQAALPFAEQFATVLGPIVATRDLIVFDQRGIGLSHPLSCHRFEQPIGNGSPGPAIAECGAQIGTTRGDYTSADTVADIEAIRVAGGYEKLVLYGTSYGTKVAEEYAQAYPSHVEALVLDSVVPPNGPEPLNRTTFAAVPRILRQLCAARACAGITRDPTADLAKLVARLSHGEAQGRWIDGHGHAHPIAISSDDLLGALVAGDLEPVLRSEFPAAIRAAAYGDRAPLARLLVHADGSDEEAESPSESFDTPLYYATSCEEEPFPWNRASSPGRRLAEAKTRIGALPASAFAPFTRANAFDFSDMPTCAFWPFAPPAPVIDEAPLPAVPTLILSGADDLRTPTANAREVAAQIPGSHLLVVPVVGHSVLSSDPTDCSHDALLALFAGKPIKPCAAALEAPLLRPIPLPPKRLVEVAPARGTHGKPGRTLAAVALTLTDLDRLLTLETIAQTGASGLETPSLDVGGLRAGWAGLLAGKLLLHGYSYVPGVTVSGEITPERIELSIGGAAAAHGRLRLGAHRALTGVLGDQHVRIAGGGASQVGASTTTFDVAPSGAAAGRARRITATRDARLMPIKLLAEVAGR
jgi:pimeloyl-ACP methyl ester carboxylesterase